MIDFHQGVLNRKSEILKKKADIFKTETKTKNYHHQQYTEPGSGGQHSGGKGRQNFEIFEIKGNRGLE